MQADDTIAAISSATGAAARMIVRISGPSALSIAGRLGAGSLDGGAATRQTIQFCAISVPAWVYVFISPRSYTGEDLVEFHIPGNPLLARMFLDWLTESGARLAEPGEFTARAYFHGKLDLTQAEGVAAAIASQNQVQLLAARRLMAGELADRLRPTMDLLAEMLALVEAGIDFSEEGMEFLSGAEIGARVDSIIEQLRTLDAESARFEKLTHEPTIVLAGRPNAGKSTLVNALVGKDRSIVSPQPGTTRDALSAEIILPRGVARVIDVAGIEPPDQVREDSVETEIERQMQAVAQRNIERADVLVLVRDSTDSHADVPLGRVADLRVYAKSDLRETGQAVSVSAKTGAGLDRLRMELDAIAFGSDTAGAGLALTSRHLRAIDEAIAGLNRARGTVDSPELLAAEIRGALDSLGRILGDVSSDDILGRIFSRFCMGK